MKALVCTSIVVISMAFASAATADNYGGYVNSPQMAGLVYAKFGGGYAGRCAVAIMYRESKGNPRASNYRDSNGGSYGLMQLNGAHRWRGESLSQFQRRQWNPVTHLIAARRLYDAQRRAGFSGFGPWRGCPS